MKSGSLQLRLFSAIGVISAAVVGALLIFSDPLHLQKVSATANAAKRSSEKVLGKTTESQGDCRALWPGDPTPHALSPGTDIFSHQTLFTGPTGTIAFALTSGSTFEIEANSKVVFERTTEEDPVEIIVLEGQILLLHDETPSDNLGKTSFRVTRKGAAVPTFELILLKSAQQVHLPEADDVRIEESVAPPPDAEPSPAKAKVRGSRLENEADAKKPERETNKKTLTRVDIERVMQNQTGFIYRCVVKHIAAYGLNDLAKPLHLSFSISSDGTVSNVKTVQTMTKDEELKDCIMDVILRARFEKFSGPKIDISDYPLRFE